MIKYGKTAQNAISAMSYLAEHYDGGTARVSSLDVAEARNLPKPLVAKVLTVLSQAGLVSGSPGPRGGYTLAVAPGEVNLLDIVCRFERINDDLMCPYGPGWCGNGDPCPLHDDLSLLNDRLKHFLTTTTLEVFSSNAEQDLSAGI